jgi:hypothetical protein
MAILAAIGTSAASAVVGNTVSRLFGRSDRKRANAAQAQQQAIQREQLEMARKEQDYRFNTLDPRFQEEYGRLSEVSNRMGGQQEALAGMNMGMAGLYSDRIRDVWMPFEDEILAEARAAGGEGDQQFQANRSSADVRQAISLGEGSQMRMGRAYGGDVNKLMAAQADNAPMGALAEATAMSRAREAARKLGWDMRMDAVKLGDRTYTGFDNASRTAAIAGDNAMKMYTVPSQFQLDAGRVVAGSGGTGASLYDSAGRSAAGMYDTAARTSSSNADAFGEYWKKTTNDVDWGGLWNTYGPGGYNWNPTQYQSSAIPGTSFFDGYGSAGGY